MRRFGTRARCVLQYGQIFTAQVSHLLLGHTPVRASSRMLAAKSPFQPTKQRYWEVNSQARPREEGPDPAVDGNRL